MAAIEVVRESLSAPPVAPTPEPAIDLIFRCSSCGVVAPGLLTIAPSGPLSGEARELAPTFSREGLDALIVEWFPVADSTLSLKGWAMRASALRDSILQSAEPTPAPNIEGTNNE